MKLSAIILAAVISLAGIYNGPYSKKGVGPELVKNGSFTNSSEWTYNSGWRWQTSFALWDSSGGGSLAQAIEIVEGKTYRVTFDVLFQSGEPDMVMMCGQELGEAVGQAFSLAGSYSFDVTNPATNSIISFAFVLYDAGDQVRIDNVSVKEIGKKKTSTKESIK